MGKQHHFLFYIFRVDKMARPMPEKRVAGFLRQLKEIWRNAEWNETN